MQTTRDELHLSQEKSLAKFFKVSFAIHLGVIVLLILQSLVLPSTPKEYIPSLRVDLVGLPDLKKNVIPELPAAEEKEAAAPAKEKEKPILPADEKEGDFKVQDKKKKHTEPTKKERAAQEKLKKALDRIKAIERIKAMAGADEIKGNQVSKGSALSGEAKTSLETTYFDVVLERIRSYWELPKWLMDQNLSATVLIKIDSRGNLKNFVFQKSSGNAQFDNEVKRTLQASSPFPLPPTAISGDLSQTGIVLGFPL